MLTPSMWAELADVAIRDAEVAEDDDEAMRLETVSRECRRRAYGAEAAEWDEILGE